MAFDIPRMKAALKARALDLARELAPGGNVRGQYYVPLNPARADKKPGSFFIWINGDKAGGWVESATGEKGDVIDLIAYCLGLDGRGQALKWASEWLGGVGKAKAPAGKARARGAKPDETAADQEKKQSIEEKREGARKWFAGGAPLGGLAGSPGVKYLAGRGIELEEWPASLRFFKSMKHGFSGRKFPCIMAAYTDSRKNIVAVHRTFLAPDGSGKAPVEPVRLSWPGGFGGAVVRLSEGDRRVLVITEGLEDGLSVVMACPWAAVWMAGALWNMERLRLPACEQVIIFADNDWGKREAQEMVGRAVLAYRRQGRLVLVARSPLGKDANDALRMGGASVVRAAVLEAEAA